MLPPLALLGLETFIGSPHQISRPTQGLLHIGHVPEIAAAAVVKLAAAPLRLREDARRVRPLRPCMMRTVFF